MKKTGRFAHFYPRFAAALILLCNFCVGSNVFLAKGLYLCYTYLIETLFCPLRRLTHEETAMKTIYILLTRSGTLLSKLVYAATGASYTHASMAFDAELNCLYSSTRKNGYTMFPAGPSKEYLNKGVFRLRDDAPCALYALEVSDEAYFRALHRAEEFMRHSEKYSFNTLGLILCGLHIRWQRRRHYFCSQFVSEVLEQSGALALPKDSTLMHPNDYALLPQLKCLYKGRLADLPQRKAMDLGETPSMVSIYTGLLVELLQRRAQSLFE